MRSFASSCHFSCIERYLLSSVVHLFLYFHCTWLTVSWSSHNRRLRARSSAFYDDEIRIIIQLKCIKKPLKGKEFRPGFRDFNFFLEDDVHYYMYIYNTAMMFIYKIGSRWSGPKFPTQILQKMRGFCKWNPIFHGYNQWSQSTNFYPFVLIMMMA